MVWIKIENGEGGKSLTNTNERFNTFDSDCSIIGENVTNFCIMYVFQVCLKNKNVVGFNLWTFLLQER